MIQIDSWTLQHIRAMHGLVEKKPLNNVLVFQCKNCVFYNVLYFIPTSIIHAILDFDRLKDVLSYEKETY
jgi:hypothetical protein